MLPYIPESALNIGELGEVAHYPSKSFYLDMVRDRLTNKSVEGIDEIKQAIAIICSIERGKTKGFPESFGIELDGVLGMKKRFIKANLPRIIKKALINSDDRIEDVDTNSFTFADLDDGGIYCAFTVYLKEDAFETGVNIYA